MTQPTQQEKNRSLLEFVGLNLTCNEDGWNFVYRKEGITISTTTAIDLFADTESGAYWREKVMLKLFSLGFWVAYADAKNCQLRQRNSAELSAAESDRYFYPEACCEAAYAAVMALEGNEGE